MSDYILSCESAADLTGEHLARRGIAYIPFTFELGGRACHDDLFQTMSGGDFYRAMVDGADTRTSQIDAAEYEAYFSRFLAEGKDVLHLCLSSGITGTVNSARLTAETLKEKYPARKVAVVDSLAASSGFGLLMDKLADLVEARFAKLDGRVEINPIGPTIGSHTGPGTVALFGGSPRED